MTTIIRDNRDDANARLVKEMEVGTWFVATPNLYLKVSHDQCVDVVSGKLTLFGPKGEGVPVVVEVLITEDEQ